MLDMSAATSGRDDCASQEHRGTQNPVLEPPVEPPVVPPVESPPVESPPVESPPVEPNEVPPVVPKVVEPLQSFGSEPSGHSPVPSGSSHSPSFAYSQGRSPVVDVDVLEDVPGVGSPPHSRDADESQTFSTNTAAQVFSKKQVVDSLCSWSAASSQVDRQLALESATIEASHSPGSESCWAHKPTRHNDSLLQKLSQVRAVLVDGSWHEGWNIVWGIAVPSVPLVSLLVVTEHAAPASAQARKSRVMDGGCDI